MARLKLWIVLAALGAVSFSVPSVAQAKRSKRARTSKKAPASTDDCKIDKDCVLVAEDCCPCSQGGKQRAIPKKERDSYEKDRKKRCADTVCTEQMSTDPSCSQKPFCGAGICELRGDSGGEAPSAP